jgi:hypothetical protein
MTMNSLTSMKTHLKRSSNVPSTPSIPLVITASGLTMTSGSANFVNSANWTYYVVTAGTGTISFNRAPLANVQVFSAGGGGGGGGNNVSATVLKVASGIGSGGGSAGCYYTSGKILNSGTINVSIGLGGNGGLGSNSSSGLTGGDTTISGNVFPSITLYGGKGGLGGVTVVTPLRGGYGGQINNGTSYGNDGGLSGSTGVGTKGIGGSQLGISIGDMVIRNYCNSGSGGSTASQNPKNITYVNGIIGDGGFGADGNSTTTKNGGNGTNGGFILAIPSNA